MKLGRCALSVVAGTMLGAGAAAPADEVTYWNSVLLDGFRTDFGVGCPCPLGRAGAMVHTAIFDAVNSIERTHRPYHAFVSASATASKPAAVAAAAHRVMLDVFPNSMTTLDAAYAARLALIPNGPAKTAGIAVGEAVAAEMVALRSHDGSQVVLPYVFGTVPGSYVPTPPAFNPVCNPEWVNVTPFCMPFGSRYRSHGPLGFHNMAPLMHSAGYAAQVNTVKSVGALNSTTRTAEQTRIAFFWANDLNGTYKPPGHLFSITQVVSANQHLTLSQNARLFALVGMAMGDAAIVSWDMKYGTNIDLWRPITAIRQAGSDGNPLTVADPNWEPLNPFTPPFPAYTSGHATFGAAHAGVMAEFFGTDNMTFTVDSEDPFYNALPVHGPRTFHKFSDAAWENAMSRVYLGVHFPFDAADGNSSGLALGHAVGRDFLKVRCPADFNGNGSANAADVLQYLDAYFARDPAADFDRDGQLRVQDLLQFIAAFHHGC